MSWWDIGNKDDVIGDQPADLVRHALQEIVQKTRSQQGAHKPSLADLLRAIGAVALSASGTLLEEVPANLREIVAELKSGQTVSSGVLHGSDEQEDIGRILTKNLREVVAVYSERWERKPRLPEWLETLSFVLRYRPEEFLQDGVGKPPSQLLAITGNGSSRAGSAV